MSHLPSCGGAVLPRAGAANTPNALDPIGFVRVDTSIQKLSIASDQDQLFTYNRRDHCLYKTGEPKLGNLGFNSDKALLFSKDEHDGGLIQVYGQSCQIYSAQAGSPTAETDIWYVAEDNSVLFAPRGNNKRTSALRIVPKSLPGN